MLVAFNPRQGGDRHFRDDQMTLEDMYRPTPLYEVRRTFTSPQRQRATRCVRRHVLLPSQGHQLLPYAPELLARLLEQSYGVFVVVADGRELRDEPPARRKKKRGGKQQQRRRRRAGGKKRRARGGGGGGGGGGKRQRRAPQRLGEEEEEKQDGASSSEEEAEEAEEESDGGSSSDDERPTLHERWTEPVTHGGLAVVPSKYLWFGVYEDGEDDPFVSGARLQSFAFPCHAAAAARGGGRDLRYGSAVAGVGSLARCTIANAWPWSGAHRVAQAYVNLYVADDDFTALEVLVLRPSGAHERVPFNAFINKCTAKQGECELRGAREGRSWPRGPGSMPPAARTHHPVAHAARRSQSPPAAARRLRACAPARRGAWPHCAVTAFAPVWTAA